RRRTRQRAAPPGAPARRRPRRRDRHLQLRHYAGERSSMSTNIDRDDLLDVLVCDIGARPKWAPSFFDLQPAIRRVQLQAGAMVAEFDPGNAEQVEQLVAAERLCCAGIGWDLTQGATVELRIRAQPAQLDLMQQFLTA